jgi:hypothetical protein
LKSPPTSKCSEAPVNWGRVELNRGLISFGSLVLSLNLVLWQQFVRFRRTRSPFPAVPSKRAGHRADHSAAHVWHPLFVRPSLSSIRCWSALAPQSTLTLNHFSTGNRICYIVKVINGHQNTLVPRQHSEAFQTVSPARHKSIPLMADVGHTYFDLTHTVVHNGFNLEHTVGLHLHATLCAPLLNSLRLEMPIRAAG